MRIPAFVSIPQTSWRRPQTGSRQRDLPPGSAPLHARSSPAGQRVVFRDVLMQCARATRHEPAATAAGGAGDSRSCQVLQGPRWFPRPQNPSGSAWRVVNVREARIRLPVERSPPPEVGKPRAKPSSDLARILPTSPRSS